MKTDIHFWSHLAQFFLEWEMFQTKVVEKIKTYFVFSNYFLRKSYRLWDNVENYCRAGQATDGNMAHAHCMLYTYCYSYTQTHTHTHSEYVILNAFPQHQWLYESASLFYVTCTLRVLLQFCPPVTAFLCYRLLHHSSKASTITS